MDCCIDSYLNKIFIQLRLICTVSKKGILSVLVLIGKKSFDMKRRIQQSVTETLPFCELKTIFKSLVRVANQFNFKEVFSKNSGLELCGVTCVIVRMLITTAKLKAISFPSSRTYEYFLSYRYR